MTEGDVADKVLKLRSDAERLKTEVVREEARLEAAEQKIAGVPAQLEERGFDCSGDLQQQLAQRAAGLQAEKVTIGADLATLKEDSRADVTDRNRR